MNYCVARAIEGVSLNGKEYILDEAGEIMMFSSKKEACEFLGYVFIRDVTNDGYYIEEEGEDEPT